MIVATDSPDLFASSAIRRDLAATQTYLPHRETGKHYFILAVALIRDVLEEFARRYDLGRDLYFLRRDELAAFPSRRDELLKQIAIRKIRWQAQQRVFDEFVQLNNPGRDRRQGVGLGLAIVRRCATLLGSPLSLRSVPGRGSCFSLELPRARPTGTTGSVVPAEVAGSAAPHRALPLEGRHIWLIEDDALLRDALRQRLGGWGARVVACESLRELDRLIEQAGEAAPDTLLTDLRLPDGDGLQAAARLRGRHPHTAVLIVTGDVSGPERQRLQRCGHPVLPKPCSAQALLAALGGAGAAP